MSQNVAHVKWNLSLQPELSKFGFIKFGQNVKTDILEMTQCKIGRNRDDAKSYAIWMICSFSKSRSYLFLNFLANIQKKALLLLLWYLWFSFKVVEQKKGSHFRESTIFHQAFRFNKTLAKPKEQDDPRVLFENLTIQKSILNLKLEI